MPTVAPIIDTLLGLSLIGVAAAIRFLPGRHRRHRVRTRVPGSPHRLHIRLRSLPIPLAIAGLALIGAGWLRRDEGATVEPAASAVLAPEQAPAGAVEYAETVDPAGYGFVLVRGTPSDDDTASEDDIRSYSERLGALVTQALAQPPLALRLEPKTVDAEQWKALHDDPHRAREWCNQGDNTGFVAVIGMDALRLEKGAGYATWREPEYIVVACATTQHASLHGRVDERPGDRIPYEQAIIDDLRAALNWVSVHPD